MVSTTPSHHRDVPRRFLPPPPNRLPKDQAEAYYARRRARKPPPKDSILATSVKIVGAAGLVVGSLAWRTAKSIFEHPTDNPNRTPLNEILASRSSRKEFVSHAIQRLSAITRRTSAQESLLRALKSEVLRASVIEERHRDMRLLDKECERNIMHEEWRKDDQRQLLKEERRALRREQELKEERERKLKEDREAKLRREREKRLREEHEKKLLEERTRSIQERERKEQQERELRFQRERERKLRQEREQARMKEVKVKAEEVDVHLPLLPATTAAPLVPPRRITKAMSISHQIPPVNETKGRIVWLGPVIDALAKLPPSAEEVCKREKEEDQAKWAKQQEQRARRTERLIAMDAEKVRQRYLDQLEDEQERQERELDEQDRLVCENFMRFLASRETQTQPSSSSASNGPVYVTMEWTADGPAIVQNPLVVSWIAQARRHWEAERLQSVAFDEEERAWEQRLAAYMCKFEQEERLAREEQERIKLELVAQTENVAVISSQQVAEYFTKWNIMKDAGSVGSGFILACEFPFPFFHPVEGLPSPEDLCADHVEVFLQYVQLITGSCITFRERVLRELALRWDAKTFNELYLPMVADMDRDRVEEYSRVVSDILLEIIDLEDNASVPDTNEEEEADMNSAVDEETDTGSTFDDDETEKGSVSEEEEIDMSCASEDLDEISEAGFSDFTDLEGDDGMDVD